MVVGEHHRLVVKPQRTKRVAPALPLTEPIPDRDLSDAILTSWRAEAPTVRLPFRQVRDQAAYRHRGFGGERVANDPTGTY